MSIEDSEEFPEEESADQDAVVVCPHCGEEVVIGLDPGGGPEQQYVEDCEVCCRPWQVTVRYGDDGRASVELEPG
ncbi:MAG TPA: CPXCG motif-containing cysteine-rich protein [Gemmatimonadales bacterium]|jgi:hypothetical protein